MPRHAVHAVAERKTSAANKSRRLRKCPRTGLRMTFAELGDPRGVPLLCLVPGGSSRWACKKHDVHARDNHIRLIIVDPPGNGGTSNVPLKDRVRLTCEMIVSVLEQLEIKLAHLMASSAGVYYALQLLTIHHEAFLTGLNPPPRVYLFNPWSPLLPPSHPDYYSSPLSRALEASEQKNDPSLRDLLDFAHKISLKALRNGITSAKELIPAKGGTPHYQRLVDNYSDDKKSAFLDEKDTSVIVTTNEVQFIDEKADHDSELFGEVTEESGIERVPSDTGGRGDCPVAGAHGNSETEVELTGAAFSKLWRDWVRSIRPGRYALPAGLDPLGQDGLLCLNYGPLDTGHEWWFEATVLSLATNLRVAQKDVPLQPGEIGKLDAPLSLHVWWDEGDGLVPREGQAWFNKLVRTHPDAIAVDLDAVPGDEDFTTRPESLAQMYTLIQMQGHSTGSCWRPSPRSFTKNRTRRNAFSGRPD